MNVCMCVYPDPDASKRGMSAYIIFSNDMREKVKAENPNIGFGKFMSINLHTLLSLLALSSI